MPLKSKNYPLPISQSLFSSFSLSIADRALFYDRGLCPCHKNVRAQQLKNRFLVKLSKNIFMRLISKAKIKIDNSPLNSPLLNRHFAQRNIRRFPSVNTTFCPRLFLKRSPFILKSLYYKSLDPSAEPYFRGFERCKYVSLSKK